MPRPVYASGAYTCVRSEQSTTSMPSTVIHTERPIAMRTPSRPAWSCSRRIARTVAITSSGAPEESPDLPPMRSANRAPAPASSQASAAIGSHSAPTTASVIPRANIARSRLALSPGAPPPGLSAVSAKTTQPGVASANASAAAMSGMTGSSAWRAR